MLGKEIPELMKMIQKEEAAQNAKEKDTPSIKGVCKSKGVFIHLQIHFSVEKYPQEIFNGWKK